MLIVENTGEVTICQSYEDCGNAIITDGLVFIPNSAICEIIPLEEFA